MTTANIITDATITQQQILEVLIIREGAAGLTEKVSHHDIGWDAKQGVRRLIMGTELKSIMERVVLSAAEWVLLPEDDMAITWTGLPANITSAARELPRMTEAYTARLTDGDTLMGYAAFRVVIKEM